MKKLTLLLLSLLLGIFSIACDKEETSEIAQANFFAMDTYMSISLGTGNTTALKEVQEYVLTMDSQWSTTNEGSEIAQLNLEKSVLASNKTLDILAVATELAEKTNGAFDISVYPIVKAWGFTTSTYQIPTQNEIDELLANVNYKNVNFENTGFENVNSENLVQLKNNAEITLGGIAKGYIADEITEILAAYGIESALLNLGGNIQAIGAKDDGKPWSVGVKNPENDSIIGIVQGIDTAIVTSSSAERYFVEDDKTYSHIINPQSGYPVDNEILSVTILSESGAYADALSTALFVMGIDDAVAFWQQYQDFDMLIMTEDSLYISKNLVDDFELTDTTLTLQIVQ